MQEFMTFLDLAMSAGIGVRKRSINETILSLSSSSCSDSDSSELYSILMVLEVVQPQPLLDAITATYTNMAELTKHVASWTSGFNPIIPVFNPLFPKLCLCSKLQVILKIMPA